MFDIELERKKLDDIMLDIYHINIVFRYELQLLINKTNDSIVLDVYNKIINQLDNNIKQHETKYR